MLDELRFDNRFTRLLPGDPETRNFRRQVHQACYSRVLPTPVVAPKLVAFSREVCELLELDITATGESAMAEVFGGNRVLPDMDPFAMCYGGHQFGNWAGQLGDGRAINLGEVVNSDGQRWMLQLKGAGPTPYSRTADGLAVLRSSVREFLCSEAMFHLGVPTTRALSLVLTGEEVLRDMFYDGNPRHESGAVVCRVAPSFIRFGNFEIFASRGDFDNLRKLAEHTIATDFAHLAPDGDAAYAPEVFSQWFDEVCLLTAEMIVHWMRVGFVHGVMNTDNMSILGLTIDYGPYGWLEDYDPDWTPNTTDASGRRYRYGNQPQVALWNLLQLANAIHPLVGDSKPLEKSLQNYSDRFERSWQQMMAQKLGLDQHNETTDNDLVIDLFDFFATVETDMTLFFRRLSEISTDATIVDIPHPLVESFYAADRVVGPVHSKLIDWLNAYSERVRQTQVPDHVRRSRMNSINPIYVLRNYLAQLAIDQADQGDSSMINELLDVLRNPYDEVVGRERFAAKRPEWARHRAGCSMLSCSS
ncbi:MAG TPA: YdiU family protein [Planctomycetaceae bacterium]|nr:YdiU family protein [Planctomycetaceae bacterium]